jgi:uroporphyrinogen III methyltransferase/synthase
MGRGLVCFVGGGTGDPAHRTERAVQRAAEADVTIEAAVSAADLVMLAREGKRVARVVPGDPLESPEVVAQARAVVAAGIPIEVVPGIGARAAAGAFAGVLGRAVRVDLAQVEEALAGEPPAAVVTLIAGAGTASQRLRTVRVEQAPAAARELAADALVVAFGAPDDALRWAERRPLFGKRVLVTRAREQAGSTAALLREAGAEPVVVPTIEIHPPADPLRLTQALHALRKGGYEWAVFTSANGVERTWDALGAQGGDARAFGSVRLAAIGPATARALDRRGLRPDVVAKEFRGESLAEGLLAAMGAIGGIGGSGGARVLLARAATARDVLPDALRQAGCAVDVVPAYETRPAQRAAIDRLARDLAAGSIDAVMFTSSSTVENLCDLLGSSAAELLAGLRVASIGPVTTRTAAGLGLRVDVTAREYTVPGLLEALAESYG